MPALPSGGIRDATTSTPPSHAQAAVLNLLTRAHSPASASRILTERIQSKPLLLQPSVNTDKRGLRRHVRERKHQYHRRKQARKGNKPLSAKEKRQLGIYRLKKEEVKSEGAWEVYKGLNELWNGYMLEVLGYLKNSKLVDGWEKKEVGIQAQGSLLASADLHGSAVEVVRSADVGRVGISGIVVRETKYTFVVVGEGRKWWTIPKKGSVFGFTVRLPSSMEDGLVQKQGEQRKVVFEIQGSLFGYRPVERANRKFKWRALDGV